MSEEDLQGLAVGVPQQRDLTYNDMKAEMLALQEDVKYFQGEMEYYKQVATADPWKSNPQHTSRERLADRFLAQKVPEGQKPVSEELYLTRSSLLELLALIPSLSRKDARRFIRDWEDIEALSQGEGNEQIVKTRQERMVYELQIYRSVGDTAIPGMTTTTAIITDRMESDQKISMPPQRKPQGWLDGLKGGSQ